jgi:hypothetical protein
MLIAAFREVVEMPPGEIELLRSERDAWAVRLGNARTKCGDGARRASRPDGAAQPLGFRAVDIGERVHGARARTSGRAPTNATRRPSRAERSSAAGAVSSSSRAPACFANVFDSRGSESRRSRPRPAKWRRAFRRHHSTRGTTPRLTRLPHASASARHRVPRGVFLRAGGSPSSLCASHCSSGRTQPFRSLGR